MSFLVAQIIEGDHQGIAQFWLFPKKSPKFGLEIKLGWDPITIQKLQRSERGPSFLTKSDSSIFNLAQIVGISSFTEKAKIKELKVNVVVMLLVYSFTDDGEFFK